MKKQQQKIFLILAVLVLIGLILIPLLRKPAVSPTAETVSQTETSSVALPTFGDDAGFDPNQVPSFSNSAYTVINGNVPYFTEKDLTTDSYEYYSELDALGRCGVTVACIGTDLMPTEERGDIGQVKPTGWQTVKYDFVDGKYLYNRCHLIGFQLSGENANRSNLITGTRYLNIEGMLPFENMVADYVKETENHVLYRVTPIFIEENLVASGVLMEGYSVEDRGEGICFCIYAYNNQPGVWIDYATGDSREDAANIPENGSEKELGSETVLYILNTHSHKFHASSCPDAEKITANNKLTSTKSRDELIADGYSPCGKCNP